MEPQRFGKFWLVDKVAAGGMAEIFRAVGFMADGRQRTLAIKRILPQFSDDEEFVSLLIDEAKLMVRLNHPNIVPIVEFGKAESSYYIAMDFVEGTTLKDLFRRVREKGEQFSFDLAIHIVREIGLGLSYAHRKTDDGGKSLDLVHRDISPANILISFDGEVKIADFGISKATNQSHSTRIGVIRGKTGYMSPEQTKGGTVIDLRSDIYSMGIILYELLTGERLYKAKSVPEALRIIREGKIPPMASRRPGVPDDLERIVRKALAQKPDDRYQRTEGLLDELNEFLTRGFPGGRPIRVTHTDLVGFLNRYYSVEMASKSGEATAVNLDVHWGEPSVSTAADANAASAQRPQTIAANPLYELSEPEKSIVTPGKGIRGEQAATLAASESRTVSLQDAVSASIEVARRVSPFVIRGLAVGLGAIVISIVIFRRSQVVPGKAVPTPSPKPEIRITKDKTPAPSKTASASLTRALVHVDTDPKSARARLYLDGRPMGESPVDLRNLEVGKSYTLKVEARGYFPQEMTLQISESGETAKTVFLNPIQDKSSRPPPPMVGPPVKLGSKKPAPKPGFFIINSIPWSVVYVDGKRVDTTPITKPVVVSAGRHNIRLENPNLKLKQEIWVNFESGKTLKCIVNLKDQKYTCK